jgi:ribosome biogenesis GTPase
MSLTDWGWSERWEETWSTGDVESAAPARVSAQERTLWTIQTEEGPREARSSESALTVGRPVVGDWVIATPGMFPDDPWTILSVLPRRSQFSRQAAGPSVEQQIVAANVDRVWIVHGLDTDWNPRRIERYLALAWESGAQPEIVLSKADLATALEDAERGATDLGFGAPVWVVSTVQRGGCDQLAASLSPGTTVALLGPSGVGKSSLINRLAGAAILDVRSVREKDRKGRHTTTRRALVRLESGALLLDTPGMRELGVWGLDAGLAAAFPDIDELATRCRFRDCQHQSEPHCAVLAAAASGLLRQERLASYRKLLAEAEYQRRKSDPRAMSKAVAEWKSVMKSLRHHPKYRLDRSDGSA